MQTINQRERVRHYSIAAYLVMLALSLPLMLLAVKHDNTVRSQAAGITPTQTPVSPTPTL